MSRINWVCVGIILLSIILFLYGANYYNAVVGWAGVFLFIAGIMAFLILYIYRELTQKVAAQNP